MNLNIFTPEFAEFAEKAKKLNEFRQQKLKSFEEIQLKFKAELDKIDNQANILKKEYESKLFSEGSDDDNNQKKD